MSLIQVRMYWLCSIVFFILTLRPLVLGGGGQGRVGAEIEGARFLHFSIASYVAGGGGVGGE